MVDSPPRASTSKPIHSSPKVDYQLPSLQPRPHPLQRFLIGGFCVSLGLFAVAVGVASITYRLAHLSVENGLVNGRTVRVQASADGIIRDFYASPGARVRAGQTLAQLEPVLADQNESLLPQAQQANQSTAAQLTSARQTLSLLTEQLQTLDRQAQVLQTATTTIAAENVNHSTAALEAAIAQEAAARSEYERFRFLLAEGAVSQQQVDELEADWQSAQSAVQQANSEKNVAQVTRDALNQQAPLQSNTQNLRSQRHRLLQDIQAQTAHIKTLELELQGQQQQLQQLQVQNSVVPPVKVTAPFNGVIYSTHHDVGEQVNRPTTLLSVLDCNDLWVEALISLEQSRKIDANQPVRMQIAGHPETLVGDVDLIAAIRAGDLPQARTKALIPAVSPDLVDQPLARVRVNIPPMPDQEQAHQFCGLGQSVNLTFGTQSSMPAFLSRLVSR